MEEIWKETIYPGYFVSTFGNVLGKKGTLMKLIKTPEGYLNVSFSLGNKKFKTVRVNRLVAITFIPNPENKPQVNHIDGNKLNNHVENLEWCTASENVKHAFRMGLSKQKQGPDNPKARLTREDVLYIKSHYIARDSKFGARALARKFNVDHTKIVRILKGIYYKNC